MSATVLLALGGFFVAQIREGHGLRDGPVVLIVGPFDGRQPAGPARGLDGHSGGQVHQTQALVERDAVIGAAFDNWMIRPGWKKYESDPKTVAMEDIANHTDHICQLAGNAKHCGLGTDLDGGFGKEQTPHDLDTIADLGHFAEILDRRGYSRDDIEGIMYRNFVDFFRRAWS